MLRPWICPPSPGRSSRWLAIALPFDDGTAQAPKLSHTLEFRAASPSLKTDGTRKQGSVRILKRYAGHPPSPRSPCYYS
ncbi:hypothetical protein VTI74DRAFT_4057 [Chaetomium olivicolor]